MKRWKEQLLRWWLGANRAALRGGALSVKAFIGTSAVSEIARQVGTAVPALDWRQGLAVFGATAAYEFFGYLAENPLPELPAIAEPDHLDRINSDLAAGTEATPGAKVL